MGVWVAVAVGVGVVVAGGGGMPSMAMSSQAGCEMLPWPSWYWAATAKVDQLMGGVMLYHMSSRKKSQGAASRRPMARAHEPPVARRMSVTAPA